MKKLFFVIVCFIFLSTAFVFCEVAKEFQYTGVLREFGQPVNGVRGMIFNIYTQETDGTPVWSSGEVSVSVSSGVFSCILSPNIDLRDGNYWIETVIAGKIFSPRQKIMPQVFALHSNTAENLTKKGDIHFVINNTTCAVLTQTGDFLLLGKIKSQSVDEESIRDGAVTTSKIADGAVTDAKISYGISASKLIGALPSNVVASSIAVNSVHTSAIINGAVTNDKISSIDASKITSGVLPINRGGTGVSSGSSGYIIKWGANSVANSIIYDDGSKVGVGTNSLGVSRLTVKGISSDNTAGCLLLTNSSDLPILYARNDRNVSIGDANPGVARLKIVSATSDNTSYGLVVQNSNGSNVLVVRSDNRVGIGKDNPTGILDVQGKIREYGYELLPRGVIVMWSGSIASIPPGWALCDGGTYTAPDGAQVTTPNLKDRFIVGAGGSYSVGATGGSNTVTLTVDQIPSHTHSASCSTDGEHTHTYYPKANGLSMPRGSYSDSGFQYPVTGTTDPAGSHSHTITIGATGGGQPHENRPPYYALAFIMKL